MRCRRHMAQIRADLELLEKLLAAYGRKA
jgi:hypothetical protein